MPKARRTAKQKAAARRNLVAARRMRWGKTAQQRRARQVGGGGLSAARITLTRGGIRPVGKQKHLRSAIRKRKTALAMPIKRSAKSTARIESELRSLNRRLR